MAKLLILDIVEDKEVFVNESQIEVSKTNEYIMQIVHDSDFEGEVQVGHYVFTIGEGECDESLTLEEEKRVIKTVRENGGSVELKDIERIFNCDCELFSSETLFVEYYDDEEDEYGEEE